MCPVSRSDYKGPDPLRQLGGSSAVGQKGASFLYVTANISEAGEDWGLGYILTEEAWAQLQWSSGLSFERPLGKHPNLVSGLSPRKPCVVWRLSGSYVHMVDGLQVPRGHVPILPGCSPHSLA